MVISMDASRRNSKQLKLQRFTASLRLQKLNTDLKDQPDRLLQSWRVYRRNESLSTRDLLVSWDCQPIVFCSKKILCSISAGNPFGSDWRHYQSGANCPHMWFIAGYET
jgi:hypothetical protein